VGRGVIQFTGKANENAYLSDLRFDADGTPPLPRGCPLGGRCEVSTLTATTPRHCRAPVPVVEEFEREEIHHCQHCHSWSVDIGRLGREDSPCEEASRDRDEHANPMPFGGVSSADREMYLRNKRESGIK
jgi:hypothetical protein